MIAQSSPELPAKTQTKSSPPGQVLAYIGAGLQLAPLIGWTTTVVSMVRAFRVIGAQGVGNPAELSAAIGEALIATAVGLLLALPGVVMLLWAVFACGYRAAWLFWLLVILGTCYLSAFPLGSLVGLVFLGTALAKRREFLDLPPTTARRSIHLW